MATILLVEDEQSLCELYATILRSEGHEVFVTHDGKSAVEAAHGRKHDLVIMDICLPEKMDGIESMSKILGEDKTIPVIINTGYTQYRDNFMTWAAEAYVVKSADTGPLLEAVREVLARKGRK